MRARTASHTRAALLSAVGVLAIVGVAVFGGALTAQAAATSVTIDTPGSTTGNNTAVISGSIAWTTDGGTVTVHTEDEDGNQQNFCATDGPYLVTDTTWTCTIDLLYGYNYITAIAEAGDDVGNPITSNEINIYRTATTPYVQFDALPDFQWAPGPNFVISGHSDLSTDVTISVDGVVEPTCADLPPDGAGNFSCTITKAPGTWDLEAVQSGSAPDVDQVVITIPPLVINNPDPIDVDAGDTASLYGSLEWNSGLVQASVTGQSPTCSSPDVTDGFWNCDLAMTGVPDGNYTAVLTQTYGDAPATTATVGIRVTTLIKPTVTCGFTPGGGTSITAATSVNTWLYTVDSGTGDPSDDPGLCSRLPGNLITDNGPFAPPIDDCDPTCTADLAAGVYRVHYGFSDDVGAGYDFSQFDYFFTIPAAPAVAKVTSTGLASGTGTAGDRIRLVNGAGAQLCTTVVAGDGAWSCTVTLPKSAGTARAYQVDAASGGMSDYSASVTLPAVAVAPTQTTTPTPTPRPWSINFGNLTEFRPGDSLTIAGTDAPANATIDVELHSTPILLGTTTADELGNFSLTTTIPMDAEAGDHHIVVIATPTDGSAPFELEQAVTVIVDPVAEEEEETASGEGLAPSSGTGRQQPGAPSALSAGFVSPAEILSNPLALVTAGSLGLALVLLVLVPAEFFGEALANHYGSMGGFFARRKGLKRFVDNLGEWIEANRFWAGAALVFVTSVVFCFIDPSFGFDLTSLRLLLSCAASILLVNFLSSGITERVAEKAWKVPTRLEVMPWGLAIAIVGVIVSRILDFSPGFLIGSIIGVSVIGEVTKKLEIRVILLWSTVVWAVAMLSWILAPLVPDLPAENPAAFVTGLLGDSLTATAAAGLTALLVALLPIALFDGGELFKHSKLKWALAFGIAAASFAVVVMPSAGNWLGLGDGLLTWLLVTVSFIAVAIITYLIALRNNVLGRSRLLKHTEPAA